MGEFFRAWRRKIGVVTLVVALASTAGWVRSSLNYNGIEIVFSKTRYSFTSIKGLIGGFYAHSDQARVVKREIRFPSFAIEANDKSEINLGEGSWGLGEFRYRRRSEFWGHYSDLVQTAGPPVLVDLIAVQIPYWSIVAPLTLLSACLLLTKPRPKSPIPAAESH